MFQPCPRRTLNPGEMSGRVAGDSSVRPSDATSVLVNQRWELLAPSFSVDPLHSPPSIQNKWLGLLPSGLEIYRGIVVRSR